MKKLLLYIGVLSIICSCSENGKGQIDENDLITFHDIEVHAVCVENWDVNGDLEISYKEASLALITDEFTNNDRIIAFPEFVYFKRNTAVYKNAFKGCSNLREIILGENITSIGEYAFQDCSKLSSIILPPSVKSICDYAFDGCEALKEVQVPNNVDVIGRNGFSRCIALELATLPDSLLEINERVFWGCKSLTELRLPDCVAVIKKAAFMGTGLTSITIPQCVTCIESFSFANCDSLIKVYALGNNPPLIADVFEECASLEVIFVPQESIDRYKNDWKAYKKYIAPYNSQEKILLVDEECLFVNSSDTIIEIGIKTNSEYVVSTSNPKWISIKKSTRTMLSEDICTVSISENIISEKRCGEVLFTSSDNTEIADTLFIIQDRKLMHNGSFSSPYNISEAQTLGVGHEAWITGYIVGSVKGSMKGGCNYTAEAGTTANILLSDTFLTGEEDDYLYCLPIELPSGSVERDALNLYDNPDNFHRRVYVQGKLALYYSVKGMKNVMNFSFGEGEENDNENMEDSGSVSFSVSIAVGSSL